MDDPIVNLDPTGQVSSYVDDQTPSPVQKGNQQLWKSLYIPLVAGIAKNNGIDPSIMLGLAEKESGFNPKAKNPNSSAKGLFQFIDSTAKEMGVSNPYDPVQNSQAGVDYFKKNLQLANGNIHAAIASHYAGPGYITGDIPDKRKQEADAYANDVLT